MTYSSQVVQACQALITENLARWTSGNASALCRNQNLIFIKPSGVLPHKLIEGDVSVVDFTNGEHVGGLKPSTDTETHVELYRRLGVGAVIHTHSNYATAFAACATAIPCVLTAMADEFGGPIYCTEYADIGSDAIALAIEKVWVANGPQKAVLIKNHGVFTFGDNLDAALKAAVLAEDCAKTVAIASADGIPKRLSLEQITKNHERYSKSYGQ